MRSMSARVCAKVNLWLAVRGRRSDGWHEIETVFHSVDLADDVLVEETASNDIEVDMRFAYGRPLAPTSTDNLAVRAAIAYKAATRLSVGLRIEILKRIPMSAGLGGGSDDAAAVLKLLGERYGGGAGSLREIASGLGSDVPFFLEGGTALATGRGETVRSLPTAPQLHFVLGCSDEGLATRDVYRAWDRLPMPPAGTSDEMVDALAAGEPEAVAAALHNDLEAPAVSNRPELSAKKERLLGAGALGACVSGSGPTQFAVARDRGHALELRDRVHDVFDRTEVVASARASFERS
jgi:4-diphosphocytidyl-2-C-methyl-D-erythritol kinase